MLLLLEHALVRPAAPLFCAAVVRHPERAVRGGGGRPAQAARPEGAAAGPAPRAVRLDRPVKRAGRGVGAIVARGNHSGSQSAAPACPLPGVSPAGCMHARAQVAHAPVTHLQAALLAAAEAIAAGCAACTQLTSLDVHFPGYSPVPAVPAVHAWCQLSVLSGLRSLHASTGVGWDAAGFAAVVAAATALRAATITDNGGSGEREMGKAPIGAFPLGGCAPHKLELRPPGSTEDTSPAVSSLCCTHHPPRAAAPAGNLPEPPNSPWPACPHMPLQSMCAGPRHWSQRGS